MRTEFTYFAILLGLLSPSASAQWVQVNASGGASIQSFVISGTNLLLGTNVGVFRSTNNGTTWTAASNGLTNTNILALAVSGSNLFAGTSEGVFLSTNNGTNWTAVNTGMTSTWVTALAVSPASGGTGGTNLFAGTDGGGVFLSVNNGTSWTAVNGGLPGTRSGYSTINCLASSGQNLLAGTYYGIFLSTNNGTSWTAVGTGLTDMNVSALTVYGTNLFAGTDDGVWRRPLSEMTAVEKLSTNVPTHYILDQNYPNPFNPQTNFEFSIANFGLVRLVVYDLLGREVAVLVNEMKQAGTHTIKWDASRLSSGVYFYKLTTGGFVQTKKMVLMK